MIPVLAQLLKTIFPDAVHVGCADAKTDPWMVDYGRITPLLVKSIQDQQEQIESMQHTIDLLVAQLNVKECDR